MHDALLLIFSIIVWLSLLVAGLRSFASAVMGFLVVVAGVLLVWNLDVAVSSQALRALMWSGLVTAALLSVATHGRRPDRNAAAFTLLAGAMLLLVVLAEPAIEGLLGLVVAVAVSIAVAGLASWTSRRGRYTGRDRMLRTALRQLQELPGFERDRLARDVVRSLAAAPSRQVTVADVGRMNSISWEQAWILSAVLGRQGVVSFRPDRTISPNTVVLLDKDSAERRGSAGDVHLPSPTVIETIVINAGGEVMTGDSYDINAANVTGAFGRNKVRDITSTASGGQTQTVTRERVATEARRVAKELDGAQADELNDVAEDIESAREDGALRKAVQRAIGVAAVIGEHGATLLDLAKRFLLNGDG